MMILRCTCSIGQMAMGSLAFALWDRRALQLALLVPFLVTFLISWSVQLGPFPLGRTSLNGRGTRGERGPTTLAGHSSRGAKTIEENDVSRPHWGETSWGLRVPGWAFQPGVHGSLQPTDLWA